MNAVEAILRPPKRKAEPLFQAPTTAVEAILMSPTQPPAPILTPNTQPAVQAILSPPTSRAKPPKDVVAPIEENKGFDYREMFKNVPKEIGEILRSAGSLPLLPIKAIMEAKPKPANMSYADFWKRKAIKTDKTIKALAKEMLKETGSSFGLMTNPEWGKTIKDKWGKEHRRPRIKFDLNTLKRKWEERPVSALLDVLPVAKSLGVTKKISGIAKTNYGKTIGKTPFGKYMKTRKASKDLTKAAKALRKEEEAKHFAVRSTQLAKIEEKISPLSKAERDIFADMAQQTGRDTMEKFYALAPERQTILSNTLRWWEKLSNIEQRQLIQAGRYTVEQADVVKWIPKVSEKYNAPVRIVESKNLFPKDSDGYKWFTKEQFKETVDKLRKEVTREPVYFPGGIKKQATVGDIFEGAKSTKRTGDMFVDPGKTYKPGFLKKRTGSSHLFGAQETDPMKAIIQHRAQYLKYRNQESLISKIKSQPWVEPLQNRDEISNALKLYEKGEITKDAVKEAIESRGLKPGHVIYAPDDFMKNYKVNLTNSIMQNIDNLGTFSDDMLASIEKVLPGKMTVAKPNKIYQIPIEAAKELKKHLGVPLEVKLFYDKPTDYWRAMVLQGRPKWQVNNVIGNMIFNTYHGVGPLSYIRSKSKKWQKLIPQEVAGSGFTQSESYVAKMGRAADTPIGRGIEAIETSPVGKFLGSIKRFAGNMNSKTDDFFRSATAIKKMNAKARWEILKRDGLKMVTTDEKLKYISNMKKINPEWMKEIIKDVQKVNGNFADLSNFERKWVRRTMPFYSFTKHQIGFIARMAKDHPARTSMLNKLEDAAERMLPEKQRKAFREGKVWIEADNPAWHAMFGGKKGESVGRYFDTKYMNPINIPMVEMSPSPHIEPGFLGVLNPIIQGVFELATKTELYSGRKLKSPMVIELKGRDFGTKYYEILNTKEGGLKEVSSPIKFTDYVQSKIPQLVFAKKITKNLFKDKKEIPKTAYKVLLHKEIPEQFFNFLIASTQLPEQEIVNLYSMGKDIKAFVGQFKQEITKSPKALEFIKTKDGKIKPGVSASLQKIIKQRIAE